MKQHSSSLNGRQSISHTYLFTQLLRAYTLARFYVAGKHGRLPDNPHKFQYCARA